jgi:hypothetical protein
MTKGAAAKRPRTSVTSKAVAETRHPQASGIREILSLAEKQGLLDGPRTLVVRGRMPAGLVAQAKRKTGITSDSKLLEAALANVALADDYVEWLLSQSGTVSPELDLEF